METPHQKHPSLLAMAKRKSATYAKEAYLDALSESEAEPDNDAAPRASLNEQRLSQFSNKGEKYFKVLVPDLRVYKDKQLQTEQTASPQTHFEVNDVFKGTYVTNKIVLISYPHNVFVDAHHAEPIDIDHSAFVHRQREQQQLRPDQKNLQAPIGGYDQLGSNASKAHGHGLDADGQESEKIKLLSDAGIDDPSLSDAQVQKAQNQNGMKGHGYARVSDHESEHAYDEDEGFVINGGDSYMGSRMQMVQYGCIFCGFLVLLILDVLTVVFLSNLENDSQPFDGSESCDEKAADLVFMDVYMSMAVMALVVLIAMIFVLVYFASKRLSKNWKPNRATKYILHTMLILIIMYFCIAIWQCAVMRSHVQKGIVGLSEQTGCVTDALNSSMQQLEDDAGVLNSVIILKLIQSIVLLLVYTAIFWWRAHHK